MFSLNKQQENMLKSMHKPVILRKLKLSEKFPRKVLYSRKSSLGIGLLALRAIVDASSLKLHAGHLRAETKVAEIMQINKDNAKWSYRYSKSIIDMERVSEPKHAT